MNALEIQERLAAALRGHRDALEELREDGALVTMLRRRRIHLAGAEPAAPAEISLPSDPPKTDRRAREKLAAAALKRHRGAS